MVERSINPPTSSHDSSNQETTHRAPSEVELSILELRRASFMLENFQSPEAKVAASPEYIRALSAKAQSIKDKLGIDELDEDWLIRESKEIAHQTGIEFHKVGPNGHNPDQTPHPLAELVLAK